jgi:uncharacterized protein YgiM (DUF1202 family)
MINAIKVFLGVLLGLGTLGAMSVAGGYYFYTANVARPARPKFAEEGKPRPQPSVTRKPVTEDNDKDKNDKNKEDKQEKELPPGSYGATVIWETGVSLRQEAKDDSLKIGSVGFKEKITVMQENANKTWVQVRNSDGTLEGWLKIGNVERDAGN